MRPLLFRAATVDLRGLDEETVDDLVFFVPRTFEEVDLLDDLLEEREELRDPLFCAETSNGRSSAKSRPIRAKRFIIELFSLKKMEGIIGEVGIASKECSSVMTRAPATAQLFLGGHFSEIPT